MNILRKFSSSLPLQLITMILVIFLAGDHIPVGIKEFFYTISVLIKDLLVLALPYIIFAYLFSTLVALQNGAILFVISLVSCVVFMNFMGLNIAYFASSLLTEMSGLAPVESDPSRVLMAMWKLPVPEFVKAILKNEHGLILGVLTGIGLGYLNVNGLKEISDRLKSGAAFILNKMFIPVVPFFILGFILKMEHEGTLTYVLKQYGPVYLLIAAVQLVYLLSLFAIGAKLNPKTWLTYLRNMLPPVITGVSTMSSAAALPFSLTAAEQNTQNPLIARSVIPATVNMNLMGDSIGAPLMIIATMVTFGLGTPSYGLFLVFALWYVMYMFTVAAVPGATILVMTPLIEKVLGFNPEMVGLATALYILYDAIGTTMNVLGNGAFVVLFNRIFGKMFSGKTVEAK
ncbi:MAG: cation:dicarboxylase symporter family transporter [Alphaproteobacteria bacterium]|nr:cation:dicarboxylase symporter family transporter [Alphaproteobacteria bacterium]